jgi:hypothetical protein
MGQPVNNGAMYYHNGIPYTYQNGVAVFLHSQEAAAAAAAAAAIAAANPHQEWTNVYIGISCPAMSMYVRSRERFRVRFCIQFPVQAAKQFNSRMIFI